MKALILCAGLARRLGSLANGVPKPLIEVNGQPCVFYQLQKLQNLGVRDVVINTHKNLPFFSSAVSKLDTDLKITLSEEDELLGTFGTLRRHIEWLSSGDFFVMHGDNLFNDNLLQFKLELSNAPNNILGAMGVFKTIHHKNVGIVKKDSNDILLKIYEKSRLKRGFLANSAIYLFRPEIVNVVEKLEEGAFDITRDLIPKLYGKLLVSRLKGNFLDIGTPKDLQRAMKKGNQFAK